jgi:drug/metabolite transporter (DMT)-like permease
MLGLDLVPVRGNRIMDAEHASRRLLIIVSFVAVWFVWGSTYLAIAIGIETMPPFTMAGTRFLLAGAAVLGWCSLRGVRVTRIRHWRNAAVLGGLMLAGGNGGVTWAEQSVPSSIAALIITTVPLWMTFLDGAVYGGRRSTRRTWIGMGLGTLGMIGLLRPSGDDLGTLPLAGSLVLLGSAFAWANGSLLSRKLELPRSPLAALGAQMTAGGAILLLCAALTGEVATFDPATVSLRSGLALGYLALFGSIVSLSAYMYLLREVPASAVGTYAFVNPIIAVALGWWIAGEPLTSRVLAAGTLIVFAVVVILMPWRRRRIGGLELAEEAAR